MRNLKYITTENGFQSTADSAWFAERYDDALFNAQLEDAADKAADDVDIETILMFKSRNLPLPSPRLLKLAGQRPPEFWECRLKQNLTE